MLKQIISNINWLIKFTNGKKNEFIIWPLLTILYTLGTVILTSIISAYVVYVFSNTVSYLRLVFLLLLCFSIGLISWLNNRLHTKMFWENVYLRMDITARDAQAFLLEPYELSLDEGRQEMRQTSIHYGFDDDNSGVAMFFPELIACLSSGVSLVVITFLMSHLSWIFPTIISITVLSALLLMRKYTKDRNYLNQKVEDLYLKNNYYNRIAFSDEASQTIRLYNYVSTMKEKISNSSRKIEKVENQILKKRLINTLSLQTLTLIRMVVAYGLLIWMAIKSRISIESFTFYFTLCANIELLVTNLWKNSRLFLSANADLTIGRKYIDQSDKYINSNKKIEETLSLNPISIEFSHVSFKYSNSCQYIIEDFNLKIESGEHLALIGKNGAGKSTLMLLLMGYLKPTAGKILINGKVENSARRRTRFSTMFQDNIVLATTITNNITIGRRTQTDKLKDIYRKTELSKILGNTLTGETVLTKYINPSGIELSVGEIETLMLARMLYKNANAYILDEPSASLDAIRENELYKTIEELANKKTVIFISHRLASISLSDKICLLDAGKIVAYGTHDELIKSSNDYQQLYQSQSKYYQEGEVL